MITPLKLPLVAADRVAALQRLGRGLRLPFRVADQEGVLLLEPGRAPAGIRPLFFESACGVLAFAEPGPLLSLMGECPVPLAEAGNDPQSWIWELFQHHLSPQLQAVFGYLRLLPAPQKLNFGCRFTVMLGPSRVAAYVWLTPQNLLALCAAGPWRATADPLPATFAVSMVVTLGRLSLPITQLRGLRAGDVLMLEEVFFDAHGDGYLPVARRRLRGRIDDESGPLCLNLISIEETSVDEDFIMEEYTGPEPDHPVVDVFGREPFDELSMALTVRCGALNLTLGELRNLAPGAVLGISGYAPGMAGLYYGERSIGQGQLVDVDGRLGLQLSRVVFSQ